jgi:hypothetical protein
MVATSIGKGRLVGMGIFKPFGERIEEGNNIIGYNV